MPCIGPDPPSDEIVKKMYDDVMELLKTKYRIQSIDIENSSHIPHFNSDFFKQERINANQKLYNAIYGLADLETFESW